MSVFEYVFSLYSLLLGLALAHLLSGLAKVVEARGKVRLGWPTARYDASMRFVTGDTTVPVVDADKFDLWGGLEGYNGWGVWGSRWATPAFAAPAGHSRPSINMVGAG